MSEVDSSEIPLEPAAIERDKAERLRRFHTVRSPPLRVMGDSVFLAFAWLHHAFILPNPELTDTLITVTVATVIYVVASWLILVRFYDRVRWVNLGDVFLTADGLVSLAMIYATGGEHSLLFFYLMLRAADQSAVSQRRTLFFGGLSVVFYLALLVALELIPGRDVAWAIGLVKALAIAGVNFYLVGVAGTADKYHRATARAVRLSRSLIGDLKQRSEQLRVEKQRAQAASVAKSQFLANMSHEIRTPLNAIVGVNRLQLKTGLSAEAAEYARTIETSAESLMQLISDILDLSKVEAEKLELERVPFSLSLLLDHLRELIAPRAAAQGIEFILDRDDRVPEWVLGDPGRVQQVLLNLVANGVKFTESGGVTLIIGCTDEGTIRFQVQDTGIGISEEAQRSLFEPFAQANTSTTRHFGGTGLGLAISRRLVELMSGTIELESSLGIGSTFTVNLPLPEVAEPKADSDGALKPPYRRRLLSPGAFLPPAAARAFAQASNDAGSREAIAGRVLVADDNEVNRLIMQRMLESFGVTCETVESGAEVLETLRSRDFDLLMLDCQMPALDGYETARHIRAAETEGRLPIVAVTAYAMKGDRSRCLAAGMDDYLAKPFRETELRSILRRWLNGDGSSEPVEADAETSTPALPLADGDARRNAELILDPATIDSLRQLEAQSDDHRLLERVVGVFLQRIPELLEELHQQLAAGDVAAAADTTHNLKGTSGTVGAYRLMSVCRDLEERAIAEDLAGSSQLLARLDDEAGHASRALRELLVS
ncbi:MAG: ATP-binding protein [Acidobacteriota bacterium]